MKAIELFGDVDPQRRLRADVPEDLPPGPLRVIVVSQNDNWTDAIAAEWAEELADPRQDLYTLEDGQPVDGAR